ncbi:MAG: methylated-DNA--[protein]-cysteine S-methyltransferase [Euryarchaeota archaeon]|nr:methylated-DNA--[protein]-cysteine S-methyltransferase [Euryarchaeota archaeon]
MNKNSEKIIISTYNHKGLYFAVGVSEQEGNILKSSIPKTRKKDVISEISDSFSSFKVSDKYENLAKSLCSAYHGKKTQFCFNIYDGTPFEKNVLEKVMKIPYGEVRTYKDIAETLGTRAYRAVGMALKRNPLPIIIPCHRVVKSDLSLGGYKGGTNMKKNILKMEGVHIVNDKIIKSMYG